MNKLTPTNYAILMVENIITALLSFAAFPLIKSSYAKIMGLSPSFTGRIIISFLLGLIRIVTIRWVGKRVSLMVNELTPESNMWSKFPPILLYGLPLCWSFILVIWSIGSILNNVMDFYLHTR